MFFLRAATSLDDDDDDNDVDDDIIWRSGVRPAPAGFHGVTRR